MKPFTYTKNKAFGLFAYVVQETIMAEVEDIDLAHRLLEKIASNYQKVLDIDLELGEQLDDNKNKE